MILKVIVEYKSNMILRKIITDPKMFNLCSTKFWGGCLKQIQKKIECRHNEFIP